MQLQAEATHTFGPAAKTTNLHVQAADADSHQINSSTHTLVLMLLAASKLAAHEPPPELPVLNNPVIAWLMPPKLPVLRPKPPSLARPMIMLLTPPWLL
jgi:hypothetical protein